MSRQLLTGNAAAAWGARLADVDYVPSFPITPQTEIIEQLSDWAGNNELLARVVTLESEHSMVAAAGAAAATGVRVFTATSSQGLLYAMEMIYTVAGWRAPFVLVNVSRALASPVTLEPDHGDVLAARDSGFLQIHCDTCQEVLDCVLLAYRVAEDRRVRLPAIVNLDGFYLSFTREPVAVPAEAEVRAFLPAFQPGEVRFRASHPVSQAVAVLGGSPYSYFRYESHLAALNAVDVWGEAAAEFASRFGRENPVVESYRCEDAEAVFFMIGSFATKAKGAVDRMRASGQAVGLVRPRLLRPFPAQAIRRALAGVRAVAVIDQNLSMGKGGVLYAELASVLQGHASSPMLASFVAGLGGRDIGADEFAEMAREALRAAERGVPPEPRLLYREVELREFEKLRGIALAERAETTELP